MCSFISVPTTSTHSFFPSFLPSFFLILLYFLSLFLSFLPSFLPSFLSNFAFFLSFCRSFFLYQHLQVFLNLFVLKLPGSASVPNSHVLHQTRRAREEGVGKIMAMLFYLFLSSWAVSYFFYIFIFKSIRASL